MQKTLKIRYYPLMLLMAFVMNAVLPFFAVYNPDHAPVRTLSSVFGDSIILCTGDGFKWVKLADLQSGKEKPKPHSRDQCPLCYAARHGFKDILTPTPAVISYTAQALTFAAPSHDTALFVSPAATALHVRAPPASFIG